SPHIRPLESSILLVLDNINMFVIHLIVPSQLYTLSLQDSLPISQGQLICQGLIELPRNNKRQHTSHKVVGLQNNSARIPNVKLRSEEHTSELQSRFDLVCRLLLVKNNNII